MITTSPIKKNNDMMIKFSKEDEIQITFLPKYGNPERLVIGYHTFHIVHKDHDKEEELKYIISINK